MFSLRNNNLKITKGDYAAITVDLINPDGSPHTMESGESLTFTARKFINGEIAMTTTSTTNVLELKHNKTSLLEPGKYFFDIEHKTASGEPSTIVGVIDQRVPNMEVFAEVSL